MAIEDPRFSGVEETVPAGDISGERASETFLAEVLVAQAETDPVPLEAEPAEAEEDGGETAGFPEEVSPDENNVVHLPANVTIDEIRVDGANLILVQEDGSEITILNAALNIPTFMIDGAEFSQTVLLAVLQANGIDVAAGPDGSLSVVGSGPQSSGFDFDIPQQQDEESAVSFTDLLDDYEFDADEEGGDDDLDEGGEGEGTGGGTGGGTGDVGDDERGDSDQSNSAPTVSASSDGDVTEDDDDPQLSTSGTITFDDVDETDTHTVSVTPASGNTLGGTMAANVTTAATGAGAGTVTWTYTVDNAATQYLAVGETVTESFTVTISDGNGGTVSQVITVTITGTNDAPTVVSSSNGGVTEDVNVVFVSPSSESSELVATLTTSGTITFDDVDLTDAHTVSVTPASGNTLSGTLVANVTTQATGAGAGTVTWTYTVENAATQFLGAGDTVTESFTVTISDGNGGTVDQVITVTITGTNDAPTVISFSDGGVTEDDDDPELSTSGTITYDDIDLTDAHTVSVTPASGNTLGGTMAANVSTQATGAGAGTVTWTYTVDNAATQYLGANDTVTESFTVTISDGNGGTVDQVITVTITGTNDAPVVNADTGTVDEQTGVMLSLNLIGTSGVMTFSDADLSDTHDVDVVSVSVQGTAGGLPSSSFLQNLLLGGFLSIDGWDSATGEIYWSFAVPDVLFDYLGEGDEVDLVYTVSVDDGNGGVTQSTVTITVKGTNDQPVFFNSQTRTIEETPGETGSSDTLTRSGTLVYTDVDLTDDEHEAEVTDLEISGDVPAGTDVDALKDALKDALSVSTFTASGLPGGTVSWSFSAVDSLFDGLAEGETLVLTYTIEITDDAGATDSTTVTIIITGTNDAPQVTVPGAQTGEEDNAIVFSQANGNAVSVADVDTQNLTVTLSVTVGTLAVDAAAAAAAGVTVTQNGTGEVVLEGATDDINTVLAGGLTYTPPPDYNGTAQITVTADDGIDQDVETITLDITPVNDAPETQNVAVVGQEDPVTPIAVVLQGSDVDSEVEEFHIVSLPSNGTLYADEAMTQQLSAGDTVPASGGTATVWFMPNQDWNGTTSFQFAAIDDEGAEDASPATATIVVTPVNDAPEINAPASIAVIEDTATTLTGISISDVDAGSGTVVVTLTVFSGSLSGTSGSGVAVVGTSTAMMLIGTVADINAFLAGGGVTYTPVQDSTTDVSLTITVNDGGNTGSGGAQTASTTVILDITPVNDAPETQNVAATGQEDPATPIAVALQGTDVDSEVEEFRIVSLPANGTLYADAAMTQQLSAGDTVQASGGTATVWFMPNQDWNGTTSFQFAAIDDEGAEDASPATATIVVTPVNDAPEINAPASIEVVEDTPTSLTGISISDVDAGSSQITVTLSVSSGTLTAGPITHSAIQLTGTLSSINTYIANGNVVFTPALDSTADVTLTITVNDGGNTGSGGALTDSTTVTIEITPVDDGSTIPEPQNDDIVTNIAAGSTIMIPVAALLANDGVQPGSGVTIDPDSLTNGAELDATGNFVVITSPTTTTTFEYALTDGTNTTDSAEVNVKRVTGDPNSEATPGDDFFVTGGWPPVQGGGGNDILVASSGTSNFLQGGDDDDILFGALESHYSELNGGAGNDTLYAGGTGSTQMTGGPGADTFVFLEYAHPSSASVQIMDYNHGQGDVIDLSALLVGYDPDDPTDSIDNWVSFSGSTLSVDLDGPGSTYTMTGIAQLNGYSGPVAILFDADQPAVDI